MLVITSGNGTKVFEPVDAALDDVAPFVRFRVTSKWSAALSKIVITLGYLCNPLLRQHSSLDHYHNV